MSTRLPLVPARPEQGVHAPRAAAGPRIALANPLLCVGGAAHDARALRFVSALLRSLVTHGCAAAALLESEAGAAEGALRAAGAGPVVELRSFELERTLRSALEALPRDRLVVGFGATLAARFQGLLTISLCSSVAGADLELPIPSEAVASAIGAGLAQRWVAYHPKY